MFIVQGFSRGCKTVADFDKSKPQKVIAGIAVPKVDGFNGEEDIHELVLSPEQVAAGLAQKFNATMDKPVSCKFTIRNGQMNGRAWLKLLCAGEPKLLAEAK